MTKKALTGGLAALALGFGALSATPALADPPHGGGRDRHDDRHDNRGRPDYGRSDHGRADHGRADYARDRDHWDRRDRDHARVYRVPPHMVHVYDYNRPDPRYRGYYANRYYRGGYAPIRVTRSMRIYRGDDGRYYCRRSDGTTGLIVGAAIGGLIGNRLDRGESGILGVLLGASAGALLGREIDRGSIVCD